MDQDFQDIRMTRMFKRWLISYPENPKILNPDSDNTPKVVSVAATQGSV